MSKVTRNYAVKLSRSNLRSARYAAFGMIVGVALIGCSKRLIRQQKWPPRRSPRVWVRRARNGKQQILPPLRRQQPVPRLGDRLPRTCIRRYGSVRWICRVLRRSLPGRAGRVSDELNLVIMKTGPSITRRGSPTARSVLVALAWGSRMVWPSDGAGAD
jgi:hypothetical protein